MAVEKITHERLGITVVEEIELQELERNRDVLLVNGDSEARSAALRFGIACGF